MKTILCSRRFLAAMAVAALLGTTACGKSGPDQVAMQMEARNQELDRLGEQAGNANLPPVRPRAQPGPGGEGSQETELK